jgi:hypothetical protein
MNEQTNKQTNKKREMHTHPFLDFFTYPEFLRKVPVLAHARAVHSHALTPLRFQAVAHLENSFGKTHGD